MGDCWITFVSLSFVCVAPFWNAFWKTPHMNRWLKVLSLVLLLPFSSRAQQRNDDLKRIYFNLYTDSIKTILNYYVNVEGEYRNGRFLPLDTNSITITADNGRMSGNEWIAPKDIHFEKVTFHVTAKGRPELHDQVTVWLKRAKDPRDDMNYGEEMMDLPTPKRRR
jgi:hypothetical protein